MKKDRLIPTKTSSTYDTTDSSISNNVSLALKPRKKGWENTQGLHVKIKILSKLINLSGAQNDNADENDDDEMRGKWAPESNLLEKWKPKIPQMALRQWMNRKTGRKWESSWLHKTAPKGLASWQ